MSKKLHFLKPEEMSVADATKPLLVASRLVGMNPKSNWKKIYTAAILMYGISLLTYLWNFHRKRIGQKFHFNVFVHVMKDLSSTSSIFFILIASFIDRKRFMVPVKEFASVDRNLKSFGGLLNNRRFYRSVILQVTCLALTFIFCGILDFYSQLYSSPHRIPIFTLALSLSYHLIINIICTTADYSFSATLSIIRKRFEQINLIIRRTKNRGSYLRIGFLEESSERSEDDVLGKLRVLRRQYHELWNIAKRVNEAYGPHLLMGAASSLSIITVETWKIFNMISFNEEKPLIIVVGKIFWVIFHITRICVLAQVCESTVGEANNTADVLQELGMKDDHSPGMKDEIRGFLSQLQWEVQNFTACKFFDVNFTLVCGILGAGCTYLVIFIQINKSEDCPVVESNNTSARW